MNVSIYNYHFPYTEGYLCHTAPINIFSQDLAISSLSSHHLNFGRHYSSPLSIPYPELLSYDALVCLDFAWLSGGNFQLNYTYKHIGMRVLPNTTNIVYLLGIFDYLQKPAIFAAPFPVLPIKDLYTVEHSLYKVIYNPSKLRKVLERLNLSSDSKIAIFISFYPEVYTPFVKKFTEKILRTLKEF